MHNDGSMYQGFVRDSPHVHISESGLWHYVTRSDKMLPAMYNPMDHRDNNDDCERNNTIIYLIRNATAGKQEDNTYSYYSQ